MICKSREFQFIPKVVKQLLGLTLVLSSQFSRTSIIVKCHIQISEYADMLQNVQRTGKEK